MRTIEIEVLLLGLHYLSWVEPSSFGLIILSTERVLHICNNEELSSVALIIW